MKQKKIIVALIVVIVALGAGFAGGMEYQKSQSASARAAAFGANGGFRGGQTGMGRQGGANPVFGQILSKDASSITVSMMGGGSKIVLFSGSTSIGKLASGTPADLTVGENVSAAGTANTDGSITATTIQIRPQGGGRP